MLNMKVKHGCQCDPTALLWLLDGNLTNSTHQVRFIIHEYCCETFLNINSVLQTAWHEVRKETGGNKGLMKVSS